LPTTQQRKKKGKKQTNTSEFYRGRKKEGAGKGIQHKEDSNKMSVCSRHVGEDSALYSLFLLLEYKQKVK